MGRKVTVTFSLDAEADRDLLRWLERQENRSAAIRAALREHLGRGGVTLWDVYQAVRELERRLKTGAVVAAGGENAAGGDWDEPPDLVAALEALANRGCT